MTRGTGVAWVLALALGCSSKGPPAPVPAPADTSEADACRACHAVQVDAFTQTAHAHTSARASEQTVRGSFERGKNEVRTRNPALSFLMEKRPEGLFHVAHDSAKGIHRADRFDVVFGSGRKGQTYLYWRGQELYQLQVSWLRKPDAWFNGPGYTDGVLDMDRVVMPRCVECHAAAPLPPGATAGYGLGCASCHGDGRAHVAWHSAHPGEKGGGPILNPAKLERGRAVDGCAFCHSGMRTSLTPPWTWKPGMALAQHLGPPAANRNVVDAHGNQVGLLGGSKCFQKSPQMTCSTCHDVHRTQRDTGELAKACVGCHPAPTHADPAITAQPSAGCVECHMPNQPSGLIQLDTPDGRIAPAYRSHAIGIYRR